MNQDAMNQDAMNQDAVDTITSFEQLVREAVYFATEKCRDIANPRDEPLLKCLKKVGNSTLRVLPENFVELFLINRAIQVFLSFALSHGGESDPFYSAENERRFRTEKIRQLRGIQQQVVQKLGNYDASASDLNNYLHPPAAPHVLSPNPQRMSAKEVINRHADEIRVAENNGFEGNKTQWFDNFAKQLDYVNLHNNRFNGNTLKKEWNNFNPNGKSSAKSHS